MSEASMNSPGERPTTVYKLLDHAELLALERTGRHGGARDDLRDGYIHLSTEAQLDETLAKHGQGLVDPQLVAVDVVAQGERLKWEPARGGQLFPHLYGPLLLETVIAYGPAKHGEDGRLKLPIAG